MQQLKPIVAELRSLGADLGRLGADLRTIAERSSLARILTGMSKDSLVTADALEAACDEQDGGTVLRALVPTAEVDTLMSAALLTVAWYDLFTVAGALDLSERVRALSDRMEAVMWKLDAAGKELPAPAPASLN